MAAKLVCFPVLYASFILPVVQVVNIQYVSVRMKVPYEVRYIFE